VFTADVLQEHKLWSLPSVPAQRSQWLLHY